LKAKGARGFTLIEALVSIVILGISIVLSLSILNIIQLMAYKSVHYTNYSIARSDVLSLLWDDQTWLAVVNGAKNPNMACWKNQDSIVENNRDCIGKSGTLAIYDIKGNLLYDFSNTSLGFNNKGKPCTTYSTITPDPECPMRLNLQWEAVCSASPCINPLIRVIGQFEVSGPQIASAFLMEDFELYKRVSTCPAQSSVALESVSSATLTPVASPSQITHTDNIQVAPATAGYDGRLIPCRVISLFFNEAMDATGALPKTDAENFSEVCLYDENTSSCVFQIRRVYAGGRNTLKYFYNGIEQASPGLPASIPLVDITTQQLYVFNNSVQYLLDGKAVFTFSQKLNFPFRLRLRVPSRGYSALGLSNINLSFGEI
jgi:prepilin-type N-terminal cleavage/methylation domain-containing protein